MKREQEVFNKAVFHLFKQNRQSVSSGRCAYRGDSGRKCVVGIFIKDSEYRSSFEYKSPRELVESGWSAPCEVELLEDLQAVHDLKDYGTKGYKAIRNDLCSLANNWGLHMPNF